MKTTKSKSKSKTKVTANTTHTRELESKEEQALRELLEAHPELAERMLEALLTVAQSEGFVPPSAPVRTTLDQSTGIISTLIPISGTPPACIEGSERIEGITLPGPGPLKATLFRDTPHGPMIIVHDENETVTLRKGYNRPGAVGKLN